MMIVDPSLDFLNGVILTSKFDINFELLISSNPMIDIEYLDFLKF